MITGVSVWGVLVAALAAMVIGTIWYSKTVFGKQWMAMAGITDKEMKKRGQSVLLLLVVLSIVTAYIVGLFTVYYHAYSGIGWVASGLYTGFLAWVGLGATSIFAHGAWEPRDPNLMYINAGNRLVTLLAIGVIVGAFMS